MKAAYIEDVGPPDSIQFGELPDPVPREDQVLIKVGAVSVNPIDTYIRGGANFWELPKPFVVGCDLAGEVIQAGKQVSGVEIGQRVWGSNQGLLGKQGTFAELCAVDPQWLYPTPDSVSDEAAAATALVGITAHLGLVHEAHITEGEILFVRGGAGGVGSMVVQMAKALGARVIATAGGEVKKAKCLELGADHVIDYKSEDLGEKLAEFAPDGVNVFWETLRDPDFDFAVQSMAEKGRIVLMAGRDARPELPVGPFYVKGCSLHGFVMFKATAEAQRTAAQDINQWLAEGKLKPLIDRVLPLAETAEAHRLQEEHTIQKSSSLTGKLVLKP